MTDTDVFYQSFMSASPRPMQVCAPSGQIIKVNRSFERYWEIPAGHIDSASFKAYNVIDDPSLVGTGMIETFKKARTGDPVETFELYYDPRKIGQVGRPRSSDVDMSALRDPAGNIFAVLIVYVDVTERKAREASLLAREAKLREANAMTNLVLENVSLMLFSFDKNGIFTYSEGKGLGLVGLAPGQAVGQSALELYKDDPTFSWAIERSLQGESQKFSSRSGDFYFETLLSPVFAADGSLIAVTGAAIDITERIQTVKKLHEAVAREKAAVDASVMKSTFLANMSHEIRTPINGFLGLTELLLGTQLSEDQRHLADSAKNSAEILLTLINDILDLSRAEAGRIDIEKIDFDLNAVFVEVEQTLGFNAARKNLTLRGSITESVPQLLQGDPHRLRQVLFNLVGNALKFTASGQVLFSADIVDANLRFEIVDTGIGMSPEALSKLFLPFSQVDISTTRKFGGSGLGLSIARYLVHLMGGEIGVESQIGVGSKFWFTLPLERASKVLLSSEKDSTQNSAALTNLKILVAEDNTTNQIVIRGMLQKLGHQVEIVGDGEAALAASMTTRYDLIVMDCQMPQLDGYEATRAIREGEAKTGRYTPIIALTASAMSGDREKALAAGMNHYLAKPIKLKELMVAIESVVNKISRSAS